MMQRSFTPSHLPSAFQWAMEKLFPTNRNNTLKLLPFSQEEGRREGKRRSITEREDVQ